MLPWASLGGEQLVKLFMSFEWERPLFAQAVFRNRLFLKEIRTLSSLTTAPVTTRINVSESVSEWLTDWVSDWVSVRACVLYFFAWRTIVHWQADRSDTSTSIQWHGIVTIKKTIQALHLIIFPPSFIFLPVFLSHWFASPSPHGFKKIAQNFGLC